MGISVGSKVRYLIDRWFSKGDVLYVIKYDNDDGSYLLSPKKDSCECDVESMWVDRDNFELISDHVEYSEYGRKPLDNYSTSELQVEIDRRLVEEDRLTAVGKAVAVISENIDKAKIVNTHEYLTKTIYTIEVRTL